MELHTGQPYTIGSYASYRPLYDEGGRTLAVLVHPNIRETVFVGLEASRLYGLHREGLKGGTSRIYCEDKRKAWDRGQNLPMD